MRNPINTLYLVVGEFRKIHPTMQLQAVQAFLYIATHEGCRGKDVADAIGVAQSSSSRIVDLLSNKNVNNVPGLDLVSEEVNIQERRSKLLKLTPKGKRVLDTLYALME